MITEADRKVVVKPYNEKDQEIVDIELVGLLDHEMKLRIKV